MRIATAVVTALVIICFHHPQRATAQRSHHGGERHAVSGKAATHCYDPSDADEIRLWSGNAPGAVGNDPCRDIPFLQVFRVAGTERGNTPAILVIPGGRLRSSLGRKGAGPRSRILLPQLPCHNFRFVLPPGAGRWDVPLSRADVGRATSFQAYSLSCATIRHRSQTDRGLRLLCRRASR